MPFPATKSGMIEAGYEYIANKTCPCGASMELWKTPRGAVIPMNPMPDAGSSAVSHFADCPHAPQFRRKK